MMNEETMDDKRGKHENQTVKLTEEVKILIQEHCNSISHSESHYSREHTKLNYFDDKTLTLRSLYYSFLSYYKSVTKNNYIPIDESTYRKYFNCHINFSFKSPRSDVCDLCYAYDINGQEKDKYDVHKLQVEEYNKLKKLKLSTANVLHCEFDFGQNLPLPKLPVNAQFFRRLMWLYIFNVHVHKSDRSYMFHFMEGSLKKGANTVCNLVHYAIKKEFDFDCFNKIFLYSDAAGGQNRNYTMVQFFSMISTELQVEIQHLFPVRGHSYCQCDRNFGLYGKKKKMRERIETEGEYVELIRTARNPPFEMIDATKIAIKNYESLLTPNKDLKRIKISQIVHIIYFPNGQVDVYYSYNGKPTTINIKTSIGGEDLKKASLAGGVGVTAEKLKDFENLMQYCTSSGQEFGKKILSTTSIKNKLDKKEKICKKKMKKEKKKNL